MLTLHSALRRPLVLFMLVLVGGSFCVSASTDTTAVSADQRNALVSTSRATILERISQGELRGQSGQSCGIYAATRGMSLVGVTANPADYFATEYVGSYRGSTPTEILKILNSKGIEGTPMQNLSVVDLAVIGKPVILNVRESPAATTYEHWVCVQWSDAGCLLYDGPSDGVEIPTLDLLSLWNGYGIVVGSHPAQSLPMMWLSRLSVLGMTVAIAMLCFRLTSQWSSSGLGRLGQCLILIIAVSATGNYLYGDPGSLFASPERVVGAEPRSGSYGDVNDLRRASSGNDWVLLDARYTTTYAEGFIANSINIPVDVSIHALKRLLRGVDPGTPFLVYCQSANCSFNVTLGNKLSLLGFNNVTISDPGFAEYIKANNASALKGESHETD